MRTRLQNTGQPHGEWCQQIYTATQPTSETGVFQPITGFSGLGSQPYVASAHIRVTAGVNFRFLVGWWSAADANIRNDQVLGVGNGAFQKMELLGLNIPADASYCYIYALKGASGSTPAAINVDAVQLHVGDVLPAFELSPKDKVGLDNPVTVSNISTYIESAAIGSLDILTTGAIRSGKTIYGAGTGWIIEYNGGNPRLDIGTTDKYLRWTGSALEIKGATQQGVKNPLETTTAIEAVVGATGTAQPFITVSSNGQITATGGTTRQWYLPTTGGIGSTHWVRFRWLGGTGSMRYAGAFTSDTGWLPLDTGKAVSAINTDTLSSGQSSSKEMSCLIEIASDPAGATLLGSGVFTARALRLNPV